MPRDTLDQRRETLAGTLWLIPLLTTLVALLLGLVLGRISGRPDGPLGSIVFHGDPEEARRILITVATATVGVFAVVVGLTLVALQIASNRYSPRLARQILRDRPTQFVLGLFVATFAYNAAGLYTVGSEGEDAEYPRLAVTVGLALLFVCIAALVYYVDRVTHTIQLHWILHSTGTSGLRAAGRRPPGIGRRAGEPDPETDTQEGQANGSRHPLQALAIAAPRSGYVQRLRSAPVVRLATELDVRVQLTVGIGDHIVSGAPLAWVWRDGDDAAPSSSPELTAAVQRAVTTGWSRSAYGDVALSAIALVDAALLSMHIFDYHTVEQSTAQLTELLSGLTPLPLGDERFCDASGATRLTVPARDFEDYLELACGEIRRKGATEPVVLLSLVRLLRAVGLAARGPRVRVVLAQLDLVGRSAERSITEAHDTELVREAVEEAVYAVTDAERWRSGAY